MPANPLAVTIDRQDPRFDALKTGHNLRFPATDADAPSRIIICSNPTQVADALQRIVSSGLRPTVRSGGHCYEDFVANNPNGAIIDLSTHNAVETSAPGLPYRISPGAVLGDVYSQLYKRSGATIPGGSCYMVGAGGHISGGGYGLLSRLHGLTIDWITGIDILTVDSNGKVNERRIDKRNEPDLFRACRGAGGGNFGIITGFRFDKLPMAPREVASAGISFAWASMTEEKFTKILTTFGDYWEGRGNDPDTWGLFGMMGLHARAPGGRISFGVQFCNPDGSIADLSVLHEFFDRFASLRPDPISAETNPYGSYGSNSSHPDGMPPGPPATETYQFYQINRQPWLAATVGGGAGGPGARAKYKSAYMKKSFTAAECSTIYKILTSPANDSHGTVLSIDSYGGAVNNSERIQDTAIAQRSSIMKLQWQCYWRDNGEDAGRLKFLDDYYTAVYTGSHVPPEYQGTPLGPRYEGCYMNYADVDMLRYSYWPQLFYGTRDLYPFLRKVKQRYDPNNIFHNSMSVRA